jgi:hypothetical protein
MTAFDELPVAELVDCSRGCGTVANCDEPEECSARLAPGQRFGAGRERFGAGVCMTGACVEPCGDHGGCAR